MEIIVPFAEAIYKTNLNNFKTKNREYCDYVLNKNKNILSSQQEWFCDTYNYEFRDNELIQEIINHITLLTKEFGIFNKNISCVGSWINLSKPTNFQETHVHPKSHFSAVYYVKVPNNSGSIIFRNHSNLTNLFPLPFDKNQKTVFNIQTYTIEPNECDLIIFRSNLQHMVEKNNSNENRVSISMNFTIDD